MAVYARGNPAGWWKSRSSGSAIRAPGALFISPWRRWAGTIVLIFLILFFAAFLYFTNSARISRLSETLLSKVLGGHVSVKSGRLSFSGTLLLTGVEVRTPDPEPMPGSHVPIFTAEQIEARFDWISLLSGQLSATQLVAVTPVFRPIEDLDTGHWNYERLSPAVTQAKGTASAGGIGVMKLQLPVVIVKDARVQWGEARNGRVQQTGETIIDGQLMPDALQPSTYRFVFTQSARMPVAFVPPPPTFSAETRPDVGLTLRGTWDVAKDIFTATTDNVLMTEALRRGMPRQARQWCEEHQLQGRLSQMKVSFSEAEGLALAVDFDDVSMMWMVEPEQGIAMGEERPAYPLPVSNVRGSALFSLKDGGMTIRDLRGAVLGYQFIADYSLHGTSMDAPFELNLQFPSAVVSDPYPSLFMAFLTSQDLIQRIEPRGKVDIVVKMRRQQVRGAMTVGGEVTCHDVGIRFAHVPYPLDHLNGLITFDQESVTFHNVTARADDNTVKIAGTAGTKWTNPVIDFTVSSDHAVFDDRLGACLPQKFSPIWDSFSISAVGSFTCRVTRSNSFFGQPKVLVDVNVEDGRGYMRAMPYEFSQVQGQLHFEGDETRIDRLTAKTGADGSGSITLSGVVRHPGGDVTNLKPELKVIADLPIDRKLIQALPEDLIAKMGSSEIGGRLGFDGMVKRREPTIVAGGAPAAVGKSGAEVLQVDGRLKWSQGTLRMVAADIPVRLKEVVSEVQISPQMIDIQSLSGLMEIPGSASESLNIQMEGKLDPGSMAAALKVQAQGQNFTLPQDTPSVLPQEWREAWKAYGPAGKMDLQASASVRVNGAAKLAPGQTRMAVDTFDVYMGPRNVSLSNKDWPEPLTGLHGLVHITPEYVEMQKMGGKLGVIDLVWNSRLDSASGRWMFNGDAESHGIPVKWLDKLPIAIAQSLSAKASHPPTTATSKPASETKLALHLNELTRARPDEPWSFAGTLSTAELGVAMPMEVSAGRANLVARGTYAARSDKEPAALDFSAVLAGTDLVVSNHAIDTLTAQMEVSSSEKTIRISDVTGQAAGGLLEGHVTIYTDTPPPASMPNRKALERPEQAIAATARDGKSIPTGGYEAELTLKDADLARLMLPAGATEEDRAKMGTGRVNALLSLNESFGPGGMRMGRGELSVRDGKIYNVPLAMGLMQMATFRLPVARSFRQGDIDYLIRGDQIRFERILLESPGINLAGAGTVSLSTKAMDLSFVTETPNEFSIPILTPIIRETRNELLQLSVTGTLDNPKVTPVPFSSIANALRALLPRSRADAGQ